MKKISIIIPCFREAKSLPQLIERLVPILNSLSSFEFEILLVNDGSPDDTWDEILRLSKKDLRILGINLSRNFGHQAALEAGMYSATGDAVLSMDADLQHPPELVPKLIEEWKNGALIVQTQRTETEGAGLIKNLTSKTFYSLFRWLTGMEIVAGAADFRLIDRKIVDIILKLPEKEKFYRGIISWVGFPRVTIPFRAGNRQFGQTSYTFRKMLRFAKVGLLSNSVRPLNWIMLAGSGTFLSGLLALTGMSTYKIFIDWNFFSGAAILSAIIITSNGLLLIAMGVMSLYIGSIANQAQGRPSFIISEKTDSI